MVHQHQGLIRTLLFLLIITGNEVRKAGGLVPCNLVDRRPTRTRDHGRLRPLQSVAASFQPAMEVINSQNPELLRNLESLRSKSDFRYYSVDILASCEYMAQELFECYTESCEIYPVDDGEVPDRVVSIDKSEADFELDGWGRWDMPSLDYYDTEMSPEGYTGYDGSEIWNFIHQRICFKNFGYDDDHWKADFNKAVSGLHSMVSLQVIKGIQEKIGAGEPFSADEIWREPRVEFSRRLSLQGETPEAIENLYFTYMLLLSATSEARGRINTDLQSGRIGSDSASDLQVLLSSPLLGDASIGAAATRLRTHATKDRSTVEGLWEARMRTRELLRIMNCVQCNKCRFHGKIAMMGLSTALQILIGDDGTGADVTKIHRVEIAALLATLYKCSRSLNHCLVLQSSAA